MSDHFTGRWLVTEYVYNPDGTFAGIVHQKRHVETIDAEHLAVIQYCQPSAELENHPMADFAGRWEFILHRAEGQRQYSGDVVGTGFPYGSHAMLGQGVWTRFGYNFTSFGLLTAPNVQLTGGAFYNVHQLVARIVGIAIPETENAKDHYATLVQNNAITEVATEWHGTLERYDAQGTHIESIEIICTFAEGQRILRDKASQTILQIRGQTQANGVFTGTLQNIACYGKYKQYGCLADEVFYTPHGKQVTSQQLFDAVNKTLVIVQQNYQTRQLQTVDIAQLSPQ